MHKHGGDIYSNTYKIDFSANINPLGIPENVCRAAAQAVEQCASYPDTEYRGLRAGIAKKEGVDEDEIICGNGAAELIFAITAALRPKKALLVVPGFAEYEQALRTQDCEVLFHELKEEQGFTLTEEYLEALTPDLDLIFLCNPNNPTGCLIPRELLAAILEKCRSLQIRAVVDSCFLDFLKEREEVDLSGELQAHPELFLLKAFTKTYAMAGLRLGYGLCADRALLQQMRQCIQPWSVSIPAQAAGCAALKEEAYVEEARAMIFEERERLKQELRVFGLKVYNSRANYIFFRGPEDLGESCAAEGFLLRDCSNYRGLEAGFYRIAVRRPEENAALLGVLEQYYRKNHQR
ncbi:MAG: pyridoxal phosphate-dependent class II aminotransferase [Eubacteriales bacterium]|nr:pyridoxal phosphate-dependent class II aminotransferase [Eubacteriales bacterium]